MIEDYNDEFDVEVTPLDAPYLPKLFYVLLIPQKSGKQVLVCKRIEDGIYAVQARSFRGDWDPYMEEGATITEISPPNLIQAILKLMSQGVEVVGFVLDDIPGVFVV